MLRICTSPPKRCSPVTVNWHVGLIILLLAMSPLSDQFQSPPNMAFNIYIYLRNICYLQAISGSDVFVQESLLMKMNKAQADLDSNMY